LEYNKNRRLDVEHDNEAFGNLIDPYRWNNNFKKIEEVINQNIETMEGNLDNISDSTIPSVGIPELGQTEESSGSVREQLLEIVRQLLLKSDTLEVQNLLKNYVQYNHLVTTSQTLPPDENVKVTSTFNDNGYMMLNFAIPKGKDGVLIPSNNEVFALGINDKGHLILAYNTENENVPNMYIDEDGHLIYEIGGEEGVV